MNIPKEHRGRFFYHFTHIDNIESIVKNGLLATNVKKAMSIEHHNVANENIQNRRSEMEIKVGPGGVVHDYVPFYFASTNKMLLGLLNHKNVDQPFVVFIVVSIDKLLNDNTIFTNASANTVVPPEFYSDPQDLDKLNWDLIDSTKWSEDSDEELHARMAEALIYQRVPLDWIEGYIVFNNVCRQKIEECYEKVGIQQPNIYYQPFHYRYFYFTKFFFADRKKETLVTGPLFLYAYYNEAVRQIIKNNRGTKDSKKHFKNIDDLLMQIRGNFCILPELTGIYGLQTDNQVHMQTVSDHTLLVVNNIPLNKYYVMLDEKDKKIVTLAAYFHDIGKGPKEKWMGGIQKAYPDHPADAIPMLIRILSEEIENITEEEVRKVCLLVIYHDLLGDIIGNGRSRAELISLHLCENDLNMLADLSVADIKALSNTWGINIECSMDCLLDEMLR